MKKMTWKGEKANLVGHLIHKGKGLAFSLKDKNGKTVKLSPSKGLTVISTFPELNTEICDAQTKWLAKMSNIYKNVAFVSISTDTPEVIKDWCHVNHYSNLNAYSDFKRDFGKQTNTLLKKRDQLARGFIIFKGDEILDVIFNDEVQTEPNYKLIEAYL